MSDVSVCIPCYNGAEFVAEAVESALSQQGVSTEVIVVDDGSTDDSVEVLRGLGDRITLLEQANAGACVARNKALQHAKGEMIQFLDADDRLSAGKLEGQLAVLRKHAVDFVLCQGSIFGDGKGLRPKKKFLPDPAGTDAFCYCLGQGLSTPGPLYRRSLLERIGGFSPGLPRAQELDLNLRYSAAGGRLGWVNEPLVEIRDHAGARITRKPPPPSGLVNQLVALSERLETDDVYDFSVERRRAYAAMLFNHATHAFRAGAEVDARRAMDRCFDLHPRFEVRTRWWYARAARWVHPIHVERFLKAGRRVKSLRRRKERGG